MGGVQERGTPPIRMSVMNFPLKMIHLIFPHFLGRLDLVGVRTVMQPTSEKQCMTLSVEFYMIM